MRLELDDPRLMDYVLGELNDGEALTVAAALEQEENKAARELVEELRGVTEMTRRILHEEDAGVALSDEQRAAIVGTVGVPMNVVPIRKRVFKVLVGVAAVALFAFATAVFVPTYGGLPRPLRTSLLGEKEVTDPRQFGTYTETVGDAESESKDSSLESLWGSEAQTSAPPQPKPEPEKKPEPKKPISQASDPRNIEVSGSIRIRGDSNKTDENFFDKKLVEERTRLGTRADFTDESSLFTEADEYDNWGDASSKDVDLYQSHIGLDKLASEEKPKDATAADESWDELRVGNLSGQATVGGAKVEEPFVEARNRLEMKANLHEGLSLTYENGSERPDQSASKPAEEQWAEYNVGNLTGQSELPATTPPVPALESESRLGVPPNNSPWQWGSPEGKPTEIVGGPGSETYVKVAGVKPFVAVKDEPLSTFSIDVDTAAYSNVRRFLSQGQLPPADAVRIEEMVNYFAYSYPQPTDGRPFAVAVNGAPAPWAPERQLVRIGVKGKEVPASERPPANLVFLLDVSGSMGDANKLPLVKESMKTLLSQLRPNDRVGIVTYAGDARLVLGSTTCSEGGAIVSAIESLQSGGSTNGGGGIQMAYDLAQSNFIREGINRVILATDGDFNVGTTAHGDLMGMIEARAKSGVFLTTLGFGMGNLKDSTLEQLADRGNGNYAYIDNHAEARKALVDQLSGTLQTIAKDVKIQVEFNPAKVSHYRLLGYENRALAAQDFNDDTKDAGEIGAGHTVTALYEIIPVGASPVSGVDALKYQSTTPGGIVVPSDAVAPSVDPLKYQNGAAPQVPESPTPPVKGEERIAPEPLPLPAGEWLTVKMRYKQPEGNESTKIDVPLLAMNGDLREADPDFRFASAVAAFGQVLRNSGYRHPSNFDRIIELARGAANGDTDREAFVDLVITAKTLSAQNR